MHIYLYTYTYFKMAMQCTHNDMIKNKLTHQIDLHWSDAKVSGRCLSMAIRGSLLPGCVQGSHKYEPFLTHWGQVTHICVSKLTIIGADSGLSPDRRQAIIWTNAGLLLIGPLGTNFSEILSEIHAFSFKKMHLKMSSAKWRPFCLGLNMLIWVRVRIHLAKA